MDTGIRVSTGGPRRLRVGLSGKQGTERPDSEVPGPHRSLRLLVGPAHAAQLGDSDYSDSEAARAAPVAGLGSSRMGARPSIGASEPGTVTGNLNLRQKAS